MKEEVCQETASNLTIIMIEMIENLISGGK